jgi:hypothetical protein
LIIGESPIHGLGVFAARGFAAGEVVLEIDDSRVVDADHPLNSQLGDLEVYCDYLAGGTVVLMQPPERHINASCDPNTFVRTAQGVRQIIALRPITAGEEITYDYIVNCDGGDVWQCHCGSERCRKIIVSSFFDLPMDWQEEYLPLLEEWFVEEHREEVRSIRGHLSGGSAGLDQRGGVADGR